MSLYKIIKLTAGQTLIETLVSLFILAMGTTGVVMIIIAAMGTNKVSKEKIVAINLAREGIEALRTIRDTNWLTYSSDKRNCWNFWDDTNRDGVAEDPSNPASADKYCEVSADGNILNRNLVPNFAPNSYMGAVNIHPILNGAYTVDFQPDNLRWILKWDDTPGDSVSDWKNNRLFIKNNGRYSHDQTDAEKTVFFRQIILQYLTDTGAEGGPWNNRLKVISKIKWNSKGKKHSAELVTHLTDYLERTSHGCTYDEAGVVAQCGNGCVEDGEDCDDGNDIDGDGCNTISNNCKWICGDGSITNGEECDDGNFNDFDKCWTDAADNSQKKYDGSFLNNMMFQDNGVCMNNCMDQIVSPGEDCDGDSVDDIKDRCLAMKYPDGPYGHSQGCDICTQEGAGCILGCPIDCGDDNCSKSNAGDVNFDPSCECNSCRDCGRGSSPYFSSFTYNCSAVLCSYCGDFCVWNNDLNSCRRTEPPESDIKINKSPYIKIEFTPPKIAVGKTIELDGSVSHDPEGDQMMYKWEQVSGSVVPISNSASPVASFVPNASGNYVFRLNVCDLGQFPDCVKQPSQTKDVTFTAYYPPNQINAGDDLKIFEDTLVTLNGSASDEDTVNLVYKWTQVGGTALKMTGSGTLSPQINVNSEGVFKFRLEVNDEYFSGDPDEVLIIAKSFQTVRTDKNSYVRGEQVQFEGAWRKGDSLLVQNHKLLISKDNAFTNCSYVNTPVSIGGCVAVSDPSINSPLTAVMTASEDTVWYAKLCDEDGKCTDKLTGGDIATGSFTIGDNKTEAAYGFEDGLQSYFGNNMNIEDVDASRGNYSGLVVGAHEFQGADYIPVDVSKQYTLIGRFKSKGSVGSRLYYGVATYDKDKVFIKYEEVHRLGNTNDTFAELAVKADPSKKYIDVYEAGFNKNAWKSTTSWQFVAFDVKEDGSDIPNRNIVSIDYNYTCNDCFGGPFGIKDRDEYTGPRDANNNPINKGAFEDLGDGKIRIHLLKNVPFALDAGKKVSEHNSGDTYNYTAAASKIVPSVWTSYIGHISGEGIYDNINFRKGTKYVKLVILANYQQDNNSTLLIDELLLVNRNLTQAQADVYNTDNFCGNRVCEAAETLKLCPADCNN